MLLVGVVSMPTSLPDEPDRWASALRTTMVDMGLCGWWSIYKAAGADTDVEIEWRGRWDWACQNWRG